MKIPPIEALTTGVSKVANTNLSLVTIGASKYINTFNTKEVFYKRINDINKWYTKIIGLDEVNLYQNKVFELEERLLTAQDKRREIGMVLTDIRKKSHELQDQIHKMKRQDDLYKFLDLMKEETEILKQEREVSEMFSNCDREEREIFTAFTNAIRNSHEKQRAQLEYTKYFGLILSITGSFLAFVYSSYRKNDLKKFIDDHIGGIPRGNSVSSATLLQKIEENQRYNEANIRNLIQNQNKLVQNLSAELTKKVPELREDNSMQFPGLNHIPGTNLLWYSVLSLVGLIILGKIFT